MKVNSLKLNDPNYPEVLKYLPKPPASFYWTGLSPQEFLNRPRVAIVGSRKASFYGKQVTADFASQLARAGVVIISGLAFGIDSEAHRATLQAGGLTVAILPSSVQRPYPASHANLARQIVDNGGGLISEYAEADEIYKENFIARNRIVAALADILLITEAAKNSGSLHTARFALEQGKTVMAVPGNITSPTSEGCNNLIKSGAIPATEADDIFFALKINPGHQRPARVFKGSPAEQKVYELISSGIDDLETLASQSKLDGPSLNSSLTALEINGYVSAQGGHWTVR